MGLYKRLRITAIQKETGDCSSFYLAPADGGAIDYSAGQFLTFAFTGAAGEQRRSYSVSAAPLLGEPLAITVKRMENGAWSRQLVDKAQPGDILITTGAGGFFVLPENMDGYQQFFFMAAGSGITPVLPLIKTLLYCYPHTRVVLIYSNWSAASTIFYEQLQALLATFSHRLVIEFLFSTAPRLERARLSKWLMAALLQQYSASPFQKTLFYTCGPFDYMRMVTITLLEEGVPLQHIRKENFSPQEITIPSVPPDIHEHLVVIRWQQQSYPLRVRYPSTILQAAKAAGIALPYSCEAGRCGSCAATCVTGKVWMSYNEVLLDDEMARGRILTCTGYPVGGDVYLDV
jgi:ferredoxin-NADP reductase